MSLLALSRIMPIPASASGADVAAECDSGSALGSADADTDEQRQDDPDTGDTDREHARAALAVVQAKRTRQSPEVVEQVLSRYAAGGKVGEIADELGLHHSTVRRMVANAHHGPLSVSH
jgi:DNA-binding IclR family transcriptional regulator